MKNLENIYSVLITNQNWAFRNDLMKSFLDKEMIPICSVVDGEDFEEVKKQLRDDDNDVLLIIVHLIKYKENFES